MSRKNESQLLHEVLMGYEPAIDFCDVLFRCTQILDDLYDGDRPVCRETIAELTWLALCRLPEDPFYREYAHVLAPLVRAGVLDWIDSNTLQAGGEAARRIAFIQRDTISTLVIHIAGIVGGDDWMREQSLKIRLHIFSEDFRAFEASVGVTNG